MRLSRLLPAGLAVSAVLMTAACQPKAAEDAAHAVAAQVACERPANSAAALAAMAENEARAIAAAKASRGAGQPAMWTLKDEDTTLHILGTVHLLRPDLEWRTDEIDAAIRSADTVVFEADTTSEQAGRDLMKFFTSQGMFTDGTQLTSLLTPEETEQLKEALTQLNLPVEAIQPMRPWYAALNLSVMQMTGEGFDPAAGVEMKIEAEAKAHGAMFVYLETVDQQLGEFAALDNCAQIDFLLMSAESLKQGTEVLDLLVSEWADGDAAGLGALMSSPEAFGSEAAYAALLTNRNARWAPGHLVGEDSVIAMLRAEGYEVTGP
jgi:hypothetical protein